MNHSIFETHKELRANHIDKGYLYLILDDLYKARTTVKLYSNNGKYINV